MQIKQLHLWNLTSQQAIALQRQLAAKISQVNHISHPALIAGVDMSVNRVRREARAAAVVFSYPELDVVETQMVEGRLEFPYVPGLLTFREAPLVLKACEQLRNTPDLVIVDGQGIAHPRRIGLASHLGLIIDTPTIGCAKSLLIGDYEMPGEKQGSWTPIMDAGETIGAALRTRTGVAPVYVSIGHMVDLPSAIQWIMACCNGYRLPETSRLAHLASIGRLTPASKQ